MKPWSVFKSEFIWSENSHFYWIELNNVIPKVWKENLYKGDEGLDDITSSGHHIIKKFQIYSLSKCNSKELYSLQVFLNGSKVHRKYTSNIFFKIKRLGGNVYTLCLCRVTVDTNLSICQYKILNNVLHVNGKLFKFKIVSSPFCFSAIRKMKHLYTFFTLSIKRNLFGLNCKIYWTRKYFFHKMHHRVLSLVFQIINETLKSLTICSFYLIIICSNPGIQEK